MSFDELNKTDLGYNGFTDFEAGAQSRQAELDELVVMVKTSADSEMYLFDELQKVNKDRDELQKRIDEALEWIRSNKKNIPLSEWHGYTTEEYVDADDLFDILKGQNND